MSRAREGGGELPPPCTREPHPLKPFDAPPRKLTHTKPVGRLLGVDGTTSTIAAWCFANWGTCTTHRRVTIVQSR